MLQFELSDVSPEEQRGIVRNHVTAERVSIHPSTASVLFTTLNRQMFYTK